MKPQDLKRRGRRLLNLEDYRLVVADFDTQIKGDPDKARVKLIIDHLNNDEGPYRVTIDKDRESTTYKQQKLYRKYIKILAEEIGLSVAVMTDQIKEKFLVMRIYEKDEMIRDSVDALRELKKHKGLHGHYMALRKVVIDGVSTTSLNTKEMVEYTNEIRQWAQDEMNITLPVPDDQRTNNAI